MGADVFINLVYNPIVLNRSRQFRDPERYLITRPINMVYLWYDINSKTLTYIVRKFGLLKKKFRNRNHYIIITNNNMIRVQRLIDRLKHKYLHKIKYNDINKLIDNNDNMYFSIRFDTMFDDVGRDWIKTTSLIKWRIKKDDHEIVTYS